VHDANDVAADLGPRGDDPFGGGNGSLTARDECVHFGFDGAEFGRARLGGIAVAERGSNLTGAGGFGAGLRQSSKIIVMARGSGGPSPPHARIRGANRFTLLQQPRHHRARPATAHRTAHRVDHKRRGLGKDEDFFHAPSTNRHPSINGKWLRDLQDR
jgi:hypothetical protein